MAPEKLTQRAQALVNALQEQGELIAWKRKIPSRANPSQVKLEYTTVVEYAGTNTIRDLLSRNIIQCEWGPYNANGFATGKMTLTTDVRPLCNKCGVSPKKWVCRICRVWFCGNCFTDHHHEGYGTPVGD